MTYAEYIEQEQFFNDKDLNLAPVFRGKDKEPVTAKHFKELHQMVLGLHYILQGLVDNLAKADLLK